MADTVTINGKRHYIIEGQENPIYLPSVTTIIGAMTDKSGLDAWRKRVGEKKADEISKFSANRGTLMHLFVENFVTSKAETQKDKLMDSLKETTTWAKENNYTSEELSVGRKLFFNFYMAGSFDVISDVIMHEARLWSLKGGGYAGRVDDIYRDTDGKAVIADYKTSRKPKKEEWIENYKLQISAYYVAYWELTGEKPDRGEIWISNEHDDTPQIFVLDESEIKKYYSKFISLVKAYHEKFSKEIASYSQNI